MKTLYLMRHAKPSWKDETINDIDRPLNKRGESDAPFMSQVILQKRVLPDEIISSPATRALATLWYMCPVINFPYQNVKVNPSLYAASPGDMLIIIKEINENSQSVLLMGHNPGLTDFSNYLSGNPIDNIPTCGIVELHFPRKSWMEIELGSCTLGFFEYPKKYL